MKSITLSGIILTAALSVALVGTLAVAQDHEEHNPDVPEHESFKSLWGSDSRSDGGNREKSSGGGFFGRLLGGKTHEDFEGKFINTLRSRHIEPRGEVSPDKTGLQLARREALGPHNAPVPLPSITAYAQKVIDRLMKGAAISGVAPTVYIVADQQIHGQAFPDGTILLPLGAIRNLDSEDQLAGLLAHEIAHIILEHHSSDWFMDTQERGMAALQFALEIREKIEKVRSRGQDDKSVEHLKMQFIAKGVVFASELLIDSPYSRGQEDEADLLGVDLLAAAGYNVEEMSVMLGKLVAQEQQRLEEAEKRKTDHLAAVKELGNEKADGNFLSRVFESSGEVFDSVLDEVKDQTASKHRAAEERREALGEYIGREYSEIEPGLPVTEPWQAVRSLPETVAAIDGYLHAYHARNRLSEGAYTEAVSEIRSALEKLGPAHGAPRLTAALISAAGGNGQEAKFYFRQSMAADMPLLTAYTGYAELSRRDRKIAQSAAVLERAKKDLADAPQLLPEIISHVRTVPAAQRGQADMNIVALMTRCKLSTLKRLPKFCKKASAGKHSNFTELNVSEKQTIGFRGSFVRVKGVSLNGRKGPGGNFAVLTSFKRNVTLTVLQKQNKWFRVRSDDGREGWVAGWLTQNVSAPAAATGSKTPAGAAASAPATRKTHPAAAPSRQVRTVSPAQSDAAGRLRKLKQLHEQGLVTDDEYAAKRKEILKSL